MSATGEINAMHEPTDDWSSLATCEGSFKGNLHARSPVVLRQSIMLEYQQVFRNGPHDPELHGHLWNLQSVVEGAFRRAVINLSAMIGTRSSRKRA